MKTKEEIKKWLLKNCIDKYGDLDLSELDFSDFDGDVITNHWKVKHNLYQEKHVVGGSLYQNYQKVLGKLFQSYQTVAGDLYQSHQEVNGTLTQYEQKVDQNLFQDNQIVEGNIWQHNQQFKGILYDQDTSDLVQLSDYYWCIAYINKEKTK